LNLKVVSWILNLNSNSAAAFEFKNKLWISYLNLKLQNEFKSEEIMNLNLPI